ncbi:MAG: hypothetical protein PHI35_09490 [Victivallaceae bacterium]|nr:hypothetical protein [Victivallaceae bacterium]
MSNLARSATSGDNSRRAARFLAALSEVAPPVASADDNAITDTLIRTLERLAGRLGSESLGIYWPEICCVAHLCDAAEYEERQLPFEQCILFDFAMEYVSVEVGPAYRRLHKSHPGMPAYITRALDASPVWIATPTDYISNTYEYEGMEDCPNGGLDENIRYDVTQIEKEWPEWTRSGFEYHATPPIPLGECFNQPPGHRPAAVGRPGRFPPKLTPLCDRLIELGELLKKNDQATAIRELGDAPACFLWMKEGDPATDICREDFCRNDTGEEMMSPYAINVEAGVMAQSFDALKWFIEAAATTGKILDALRLNNEF